MSQEKFNIDRCIERKAKSVELGFTDSFTLERFKRLILYGYEREFVKHYALVSVAVNDKAFLEWEKRFIPLSEEELDKIYLLNKD